MKVFAKKRFQVNFVTWHGFESSAKPEPLGDSL